VKKGEFMKVQEETDQEESYEQEEDGLESGFVLK